MGVTTTIESPWLLRASSAGPDTSSAMEQRGARGVLLKGSNAHMSNPVVVGKVPESQRSG